ncbi:hypothetical protein INT45_003533, partial [Circinella minor]
GISLLGQVVGQLRSDRRNKQWQQEQDTYFRKLSVNAENPVIRRKVESELEMMTNVLKENGLGTTRGRS